jgi:hypothetical protein
MSSERLAGPPRSFRRSTSSSGASKTARARSATRTVRMKSAILGSMATKSKAPPPRHTMEVDMSWLDAEEKKKGESLHPVAKRAKVAPPPLPGAKRHIPPMPVEHVPTMRPPRRPTIEVKAEWVEDPTRESTMPARSKRPPARRSSATTSEQETSKRAASSPPARARPSKAAPARLSKAPARPSKAAPARSSKAPGRPSKAAPAPEAPKKMKRAPIPRED